MMQRCLVCLTAADAPMHGGMQTACTAAVRSELLPLAAVQTVDDPINPRAIS